MGTNRKKPFDGFGEVTVATGVTALPTPPVFFGDVATNWHAGRSVPGRFDLEMSAAAALEITDAELFGVVLFQVAIVVDTVISVTFATDNIEATTHNLLTGYGPIAFTGADLPSGIVAGTDYFVIKADADNFQVALTLHDAMEGTQVALADDGSGVMTFIGSAAMTPFLPDSDHSFAVGSNNAFKPILMSYGLLGPAADGAISLTATEGYTTAIEHRPRAVLYAVTGTLDGAVATIISLHPVDDIF